MVKRSELENLTRVGLADFSRKHGIKGYSCKSKEDMIKVILGYYKTKKILFKCKKCGFNEYSEIKKIKIKNGEKFRTITRICHKCGYEHYKEIYLKTSKKQESFFIRKEILDIIFNDLFVDTKDISEILKLPINKVYEHCKWLEDHDLIYGEAQNGKGISAKRGTHRVKSVLWEGKYHRESYQYDNFDDAINELKKKMNI